MTMSMHAEAKEFWDGCEAERLLVQRCASCGHWQYYPRLSCTECGASDLEWAEASGDGEIFSFSIVERGFGRFVDRAPYVVALVKLAEGPVMMTNIVDAEPAALAVDLPVTVVFRDDDALGAKLPYFVLAEGERA